MAVPASPCISLRRASNAFRSRVNGCCSRISQLKGKSAALSSRLPSPSKAWRKRAAESASYFSSLAVDPEVSTIRTTESACSVWCSNTATCRSTPLSYTSNSSLPSVPTVWPASVLTLATTRTRLTLVRKTVGCCARSAPAESTAASLASRGDSVIPLSFHPNLAVQEVLLLPDGNYFLEPVDPLERSLEGGPPVRRRDD